MPPELPHHRDIDLTGFYRFDLKTIVLLLAFAGQWYDARNAASITKDTLAELKRQQAVQQYEIASIKLALAENGIKFKKGD